MVASLIVSSISIWEFVPGRKLDLQKYYYWFQNVIGKVKGIQYGKGLEMLIYVFEHACCKNMSGYKFVSAFSTLWWVILSPGSYF
jgi:hypothetical protein